MANGKAKKWYQSWTVIGAILYGGLEAAQSVGAVPPGSTNATVGLAEALSQVLIVLGIRKAVRPDLTV